MEKKEVGAGFETGDTRMSGSDDGSSDQLELRSRTKGIIPVERVKYFAFTGEAGPMTDFAKYILATKKISDKKKWYELIMKVKKFRCRRCKLKFHTKRDCSMRYIVEDMAKLH